MFKETLAIVNITSYDQNNKVTLPILQAEPVTKLKMEQEPRKLWGKKKQKKNFNFLHKTLHQFPDGLLVNKVKYNKTTSKIL